MPRLPIILELAGYGLAVAFAVIVDVRLLVAEAAIACIAVGTALDKRR